MRTWLTPELTARAVSTALRSASLYWMDGVTIDQRPYMEGGPGNWDDPRFFAGDFVLRVFAEDSENTVNREDIERAWDQLLDEEPELAQTILEGNPWPSAADEFWQRAVFGQKVYN